MATKVKAKASGKKKAAVGARKVKSAPRKKRAGAGDSGSIVEKALRRGRTSTSRVSSKNQVTIPVDILRKAGLKEGDEVSFAVNEKNEIELRIARRREAILRLSKLGPGIFDNYDLEEDRNNW